jgi:NAD-dependent dihydropyrimidine dehydrogenase PreA subunit
MVYDAGACVYDCNACGQVCPTFAIMPLPLEEKRLTQIGKARFVKDDCVISTRRTMCGACTEHCPTGAVHMVPFEAGLTIPVVDDDLCIGCGACEHPCPAEPRKAIFVEACSPHGRAKSPTLPSPSPSKNPGRSSNSLGPHLPSPLFPSPSRPPPHEADFPF